MIQPIEPLFLDLKLLGLLVKENIAVSIVRVELVAPIVTDHEVVVGIQSYFPHNFFPVEDLLGHLFLFFLHRVNQILNESHRDGMNLKTIVLIVGSE